MHINNIPLNLSQREIAAALHIWSRAAVSLCDIRHNLISREDAVRGYRLPASAFLYASGGKAEILLNTTAYHVERFGLFHCGKGTELTILPHCEWLEYYMVLYKACEPDFHRREYVKMLEQTNPFRQQYGFAPENPIFLWELLRQMFESWKQPTPLDHFYEKASFYQLVYEIYKELQSGRINVLQPDIVEMAKRYLNEQYGKAIAIQDICDMLGVSYSHFHRSFKKQTGVGPQEYLINVRITQAKLLLRRGDTLIPDIGRYCGFQDERNFRRAFMKNTGLTPNAYREELPSHTQDYALENLASFPYNCQSVVSGGELKGKGATYMLKQTSSKAVVAATLSLMLLMSACGTAPANSNATGSTPPSVVTETEAPTPVEAGKKVVSTVKGDVEIPQSPKRVVVMNYAFGDILALGITPAAVNDYWAIEGSSIENLLKDIPRATNPEEIMNIEPDLIITAYEKDEDYEKLSKIAPTVSFGTAKETTQQTLEERLTFLSDILGVEQAVKEKVLSDHYTLIEHAKQTLMDAGFGDKTFTLVTNSMEEPAIVVSSYKGAQALYVDLGMQRNEKGQEIFETGEWYAALSLEVLPEYCGDYLILFGDGENNAFLGNGVYESIDAVKNGNVILMNEHLSTFNDVISVSGQIDFFLEQLLATGK